MRVLFLAGITFALAYTQSPLGFSNQNQYLLHGYAQSGYGDLHADWLANTRDPTPIFSWYIALTRIGNSGIPIFISYSLILFGYLLALTSLIESSVGLPTSRSGRLFALAMILLTHAAVWRWCSVQLFGVDYPWYFQCGVAGQYILGAGFQPSTFGVLLLVSLAAFLRDRTSLAVASLVAAAALHFTYLLPSSLLGAGYLVSLSLEKGFQPARKLAIGLIVPLGAVVAYNAIQFMPTDAATFAEAQRLLVEVRIPHHTKIQRWLDPIAGLQVGWIVVGIAIVIRQRLGRILAVGLFLATVLTIVVAITENYLLALLFPWRISVLLVPVSTAIILVKITKFLEQRWSAILELLAWPIIAVSLGFGCYQFHETIGYNMNEASENGLYEFVRRTRQPSDRYLIPTRIPSLSGGKRGNISTTFTPPPRPTSGNLIPVDLQRFRLATGAPIHVDFKAIPYADLDVLEWYRRVQDAERWYQTADWSSLDSELGRAGITHIVVNSRQELSEPLYQLVYQDDSFRVYRRRKD